MLLAVRRGNRTVVNIKKTSYSTS